MKRTRRHQEGYVFKKGSAWYLRYYDRVAGASGDVEHKQKCRKLVDAVGRFRTKQAARELAKELLKPLNDGRWTAESTMTVELFVEKFYLPFVSEQKRVSTYKGYVHLWSRLLKSRTSIALRDFRTIEGENLMRDIARTETLNRTSLAHIKSFLSGAFRYARRQGTLSSENPMRDVVIPKARAGNETCAYSLEGTLQMLVVVLSRLQPLSRRLLSQEQDAARSVECFGRTTKATRCELPSPFLAATWTNPRPRRARHRYR
jgi:hypothetical protein